MGLDVCSIMESTAACFQSWPSKLINLAALEISFDQDSKSFCSLGEISKQEILLNNHIGPGLQSFTTFVNEGFVIIFLCDITNMLE